MTTDSRFHLEKPPVKRVTLAVNFRAEPRLQGWHLDAFFQSVSRRYLSREETAPSPSADADAYEFLPSTGGWPIPRTEFAGEERSLAVQGDGLEVAWDFGDEEKKEYPGFDSLMSELEAVLADLVDSVQGHGVSISPQEVRCMYVNEIEGLTTSELAVGILTDWADVRTRPSEGEEEGYVGVRLHGRGNTDEHRCPFYVMVDSVEGGAPALSFRVGRMLDPDEDDGPVQALRQAHDELIVLFRTYTPDRLRTQWGES